MKDDVKEMKSDVKEVKDDGKEVKGDVKEVKDDVKEMKNLTQEILREVQYQGKNKQGSQPGKFSSFLAFIEYQIPIESLCN